MAAVNMSALCADVCASTNATRHLLEQFEQLGLREGVAAAAHALPHRLAALLQPDEAMLRALRLGGRLHPGVVEAHNVRVRPHVRPRLRLLRAR